jgi:hypothetical protein
MAEEEEQHISRRQRHQRDAAVNEGNPNSQSPSSPFLERSDSKQSASTEPSNEFEEFRPRRHSSAYRRAERLRTDNPTTNMAEYMEHTRRTQSGSRLETQKVSTLPVANLDNPERRRASSFEEKTLTRQKNSHSTVCTSENERLRLVEEELARRAPGDDRPVEFVEKHNYYPPRKRLSHIKEEDLRDYRAERTKKTVLGNNSDYQQFTTNAVELRDYEHGLGLTRLPQSCIPRSYEEHRGRTRPRELDGTRDHEQDPGRIRPRDLDVRSLSRPWDLPGYSEMFVLRPIEANTEASYDGKKYPDN